MNDAAVIVKFIDRDSQKQERFHAYPVTEVILLDRDTTRGLLFRPDANGRWQAIEQQMYVSPDKPVRTEKLS